MTPENLLTVEQTQSLQKYSAQIAELDQKAETFAAFFELDGRRLEEIAKNYSKQKHSAKYLNNKVKLYLEEVQTVLNSLEGKWWYFYTEKYARTLSTKDIQMYISAVPEVVTVRQIIVNLNYVRGKYEAILDALDGLNWMISNMTKLRIASLEEEII